MRFMTPEERKELDLKWLAGLQMHGIKLGLENITELLRKLGNPQRTYPCIHVAGSDGKGSTCEIIASVLEKSGFRVGLYTSPEVLDFRERIAVNGEPISEDREARLCGRLKHECDDMAESGRQCTFFEVTTAMAMMHFRDEKVDIAVFEVGMGGRFDATNVVTPLVSVISNISLEHTEYLGDTIEKIAFEKAGIIKEGVPCVTINPEPALGVIRKRAEEMHAPLTAVDPEKIRVTKSTEKGPEFSYEGKDCFVSIPGRNEARNACLALEALKLLPGYREKIEQHVQEGMASARWPCRLERRGRYIIDVTHTRAGADGLARDVSEIYGRVVTVFGILKDKDAPDIAADIASFSSAIVATQPEGPRARPAEDTWHIVKKVFPAAEMRPTVEEAVARAEEIAGEGVPILITGSFRMAEAFLRCRKMQL